MSLSVILGVVLLAFPYLLVLSFRDRIRGFLYVTAFSLLFQTALALVTQAAGAFYYPVIIGANALVAAVSVAALLIRRPRPFSRPAPSSIWIGLFVLAAFAVAGYELWSVHYDYTGIADSVNGSIEVSHSAYPYPTFSDEWVEAGMARSAIASHGLPSEDPLDPSQDFVNLLLPFSSLVPELFLVIGSQPVSDFAALAIAFGLLICALLYALMRKMSVPPIAAALAILCVPLIAESGNLPGLWFLLPYTAGFVALVIAIAAIAMRDALLAGISALLCLVLYPPMIVFAAPTLIFAGRQFWRKAADDKRIVAALLAFLAVSAISAVVILAHSSGLGTFMAKALSAISRPNLDGGFVSYPIWRVLPWPVLIFAGLGLWRLWRQRAYALLAAIGIGLAYWVFYIYHLDVVAIEYPRIVDVTAMLLIVSAGSGIAWAMEILMVRKAHIAYALAGCVLAVAAYASASYPFGYDAKYFPLAFPTGDGSYEDLYPSPPINRHLVPDDMALFAGVKGVRFTAPPWKALAVGIATDNYPLQSKSALAGADLLSYSAFQAADCADKSSMLREYGAAYAYSSVFSCPGFTDIGSSSEGLHLYRFDGRL